MHYMLTDTGCYVQFLQEDLKTPLRRKFTFKYEQKVRDMVERGSAERTLADQRGYDEYLCEH